MHDPTTWRLASGHDRHALDILDGVGPFDGVGPHYSRRTPGSKSFTGVGREIVLTTDTALWSVVYQMTPQGKHWVFRNNVFRNLGTDLSSDLIRSAYARTCLEWVARYGALPVERLRTEIGVAAVKSHNPGYCYRMAGWTRGETRRGILFYYAPTTETAP